VIKESRTEVQDAVLRGSGGAAVDAQRMGCGASPLFDKCMHFLPRKHLQRRQEQGRAQIPLKNRV
jgi:hypothetical protein